MRSGTLHEQADLYAHPLVLNRNQTCFPCSRRTTPHSSARRSIKRRPRPPSARISSLAVNSIRSNFGFTNEVESGSESVTPTSRIPSATATTSARSVDAWPTALLTSSPVSNSASSMRLGSSQRSRRSDTRWRAEALEVGTAPNSAFATRHTTILPLSHRPALHIALPWDRELKPVSKDLPPLVALGRGPAHAVGSPLRQTSDLRGRF